MDYLTNTRTDMGEGGTQTLGDAGLKTATDTFDLHRYTHHHGDYLPTTTTAVTSSSQHHTQHKNHNDNNQDYHYSHHLPRPSSPSTAATTSSTKYWGYPTDRAFINSNHPPVAASSSAFHPTTTTTSSPGTKKDKTVNSYPTSDRDAVISALKNLQDKVKKLELERTEAEQNLHTLATETEQYKELLNHDQNKNKAKSFTFGAFVENGDGYASNQAKELEGQLSSAENRCRLLEQQLQNMHTMVASSERSRRELMERTTRAKQEKEKAVLNQKPAADVAGHVDRLNELERDQMKLTATQSLAETKIRELEEKVKEERVHRRILQEKTAILESEKKQSNGNKYISSTASSILPHAPRIPVTTQTPHIQKKSTGTSSGLSVNKTKKPPKKKLKKKAAATRRPASAPGVREREHSRHYRLNFAEIPFVAGQSTSASHSLGANFQKVLAMMKTHNTALCSSHAKKCHHHHNHHNNHHRPGSPSTASTSSSTGGSAGETATDASNGGGLSLSELLGQLQDELGQLCSHQKDVMSELHAAHARGDICRQTELEGKLEVLVSKMEAKSGQIAKLRQHQNRLENGKKCRPQSAKTTGVKSKRCHPAVSRPNSASAATNGYHHYSHNNYHNNVNDNLRPKPHNCNKAIGNSAMGNPALYMLREMKKVQSTLRKDDLTWD